MNTANIKLQRSEIVKWLKGIDAEHFITINFNRRVSEASCRTALRHFFAEVDRRLLGPNWTYLSNRRSDFVLFVENIESNFHLHGIGRFALSRTQKSLEEIVSKKWLRQMPGGSVDLQKIYDLEGASHYATKQLNGNVNFQRFILSREFWP